MKGVVISLLILFASPLFSQIKQRFEEADQVVWCGIDYSKVKFIIRSEKDTFSGNVQDVFDAMNGFVISDPGMYPVKSACGNKPVIYMAEIVRKNNHAFSTVGYQIMEEYRLDSNTIDSLVKSYPIIDKAPVSFVMIAESLNSREFRGYYYTVFFDSKSREIIWMKRYKGRAAGATYIYWPKSLDAVLRYLADDFKSEVLKGVVK